MFEDILKEYGGQEVTAMDVYRDMFQLGYGLIQRSGEYGSSSEHKANPIGYWKNNDEEHGHFRIMLEDTFEETLKELQAADFSLLNGVTYYGRRRDQARSSSICALIFDLDGVTDEKLKNFVHAASSDDYEIYPMPNYVILSGTGVHLYYIFEEPVQLFPYIKTQLKELKYALTRKIWNPYTSTEEAIQYQGIYQAFRVIGGKTSRSEGTKVRAFLMNTHPFSLEELGRYIPEEYRVEETKLYKESKMTLSEAKKKYPEWYESVVVGGNKQNGHWICKKDLYYWWIRKIKEGATFRHRYHAIMCLVVYAVKSGITYEEVKKDAYELQAFMNTISPENPFTDRDIESALECYDKGFYRFPIKEISRRSAITIQPNKRNYRKQKVHLKIARSTLDIMNEEHGTILQGRKDKESVIVEWQQLHPEGRKADCIRDTGISKPTVLKHWKTAEELQELRQQKLSEDEEKRNSDQFRRLERYQNSISESIDTRK